MLLTQEKSTNHIKSFRRAVYASRNIKSGTTIREEDLVSLRPNHGLDARKFFCLIGKKANTNINKLSKLSVDMFD